MRTSSALAVAAFLAAAAAQPAAAANQTVKATPGFAFLAKRVAVKPGETVTFVNTGGVHNVKFEDGAFTQPADPAPAPWTTPARTFTAPGAYRYFCALHGGPGGAGMSGTVFVNAAGAVPDIVAPRLSRVSALSGAGKVTLRITSSEAATVTVTLTRRNARKAYVAFGSVRVTGRKGLTQAVVTRTATGRRLTPGRYRAKLVATDQARNRSAAVTISFPVT